MPLELVRNDITHMQVDAVVNAANEQLKMGGGVCGAIFRAAGADQLQAACDEIGHCPTGGAVRTPAFDLRADHIIHTVGPIWKGGGHGEEKLLRSCYRNSLTLAISHGCESIAFPVISSGIYGYPKEQALQIAIGEIHAFLMQHDLMAYIVVFDKAAFDASGKLYKSIREFIDEHYVEQQQQRFSRYRRELLEDIEEEPVYEQSSMRQVEQQRLEDVLNQIEETFSQRLFRFIDEKGMTDVETYKKANIDRRLFSKIRNSPDYTPLKKTVVAFAVALELDLEETKELLAVAGYTLSRSNKFDVIIEYFITQGNYRIHEINEALFAFDQTLLGA
ncbi:macro domain-containing protein [Planococcus salinus]|uniref:Macro domain-containing protein n=1 Tax=Planococcus salinus TaxID=1848460 RepID=A0A3M8PC13_9BACL|nr:macro domain-containing protein [Planococcus salinus]RNF41255.1 macro domain-containing protein [Planococcus salinus]